MSLSRDKVPDSVLSLSKSTPVPQTNKTTPQNGEENGSVGNVLFESQVNAKPSTGAVQKNSSSNSSGTVSKKKNVNQLQNCADHRQLVEECVESKLSQLRILPKGHTRPPLLSQTAQSGSKIENIEQILASQVQRPGLQNDVRNDSSLPPPAGQPVVRTDSLHEQSITKGDEQFTQTSAVKRSLSKQLECISNPISKQIGLEQNVLGAIQSRPKLLCTMATSSERHCERSARLAGQSSSLGANSSAQMTDPLTTLEKKNRYFDEQTLVQCPSVDKRGLPAVNHRLPTVHYRLPPPVQYFGSPPPPVQYFGSPPPVQYFGSPPPVQYVGSPPPVLNSLPVGQPDVLNSLPVGQPDVHQHLLLQANTYPKLEHSRLLSLILTENKLKLNSYPYRSKEGVFVRGYNYDENAVDKHAKKINPGFSICTRCKTRITSKKRKKNCGASPNETSQRRHTFTKFPAEYLSGPFVDFVEARKRVADQIPAIYSLDCEMLYTTFGFEVGKVTLVSGITNGIRVDYYVKPTGIIIDLNQEYSGLTEEKVKAGLTFSRVRKLLLSHIHSEDILIGHGLSSDLQALRILHNYVVDTAVLFCPPKTPKPKLKDLCLTHLGRRIQQGSDGHDSVQDARAALELVKCYCHTLDRGSSD